MQLLETIKCKNGKLCNLKFHQARFNLARKNVFASTDIIDLKNVIKIPDTFMSGLFRCRILYTQKIEKIEFLPHVQKSIKSLRLVEDNTIDYQFKYADRAALENLYNTRGNCDDVLIVKNGCITDSFTANPIFFDGGKWWTPDTPLLPGTQRARLISEGKLSVCRIAPEKLSMFKKVGLINALQDMSDMPVLDINSIVLR